MLKIGAFEAALVDYMASSRTDLLGTLNDGDWNDELESQLTAALDDFKATGSW
jgi:F-type H+-transporting ATPase subunit alpha